MAEAGFTTKPLYGGAIEVQLPNDLIDASDLRDIPDHQEVFLSRQTLTSIIFEINEFQTGDHIDSSSSDGNTATATAPSTTTTTQPAASASASSANISAAEHHFKDLIDAQDTLSPAGLDTTLITLHSKSLTGYPAYLTSGTILVHDIDKKARANSLLPPEWQSDPAMQVSETRTTQLLVRMKEYGTDLCVRVDVPLKEYGDDRGRVEGEMGSAGAVMGRIVGTLDVRDFGLFGGEV